MKLNYSLFFIACYLSLNLNSVSQKIVPSPIDILVNNPALVNAHVGICLYDAASGKDIYNYNADKFFVPASNVKLFTLYAGMKYLKDSLPGLKYYESNDTIFALGTGDPTFKHRDFTKNPVIDFLKKKNLNVVVSSENWRAERFGEGWSWDDYSYSMMTERSPLPIYGNNVKVEFKSSREDSSYKVMVDPLLGFPKINTFVNDTLMSPVIKRKFDDNEFEITYPSKRALSKIEMPFVTDGLKTAVQLLKPEIKIIDSSYHPAIDHQYSVIYSQPSDSLFKLMMHRSDNFFAEQTLMMVSNERLGYMDDKAIVDSMLSVDLKEMLPKPRWVDGSGLSRHNLFTPRSLVFLLEKLKDEFGLNRMKSILPTGGQGTLSGYYKEDTGYIYAKTGTISNITSLSGYLYTTKGRLFAFSILINNFTGKATPVRHAIENFLQTIRKNH